ncbi:uncharacterized protein [Watersipora subatra]|uniref:uncharacterized protein n=1 Tax=Watersipora subatra TaxID=2589382 RepID=UPI00355C26DC
MNSGLFLFDCLSQTRRTKKRKKKTKKHEDCIEQEEHDTELEVRHQLSQTEQSTQVTPSISPRGSGDVASSVEQADLHYMGNPPKTADSCQLMYQTQHSATIPHEQKTVVRSQSFGNQASTFSGPNTFRMERQATSLELKKVLDTENCWYSPSTDWCFREKHLPEKDTTSLQSFYHHTLKVTRIDENLWRTSDGRLLELLTYYKERGVDSNSSVAADDVRFPTSILERHSRLESEPSDRLAFETAHQVQPIESSVPRQTSAVDNMESSLSLELQSVQPEYASYHASTPPYWYIDSGDAGNFHYIDNKNEFSINLVTHEAEAVIEKTLNPSLPEFQSSEDDAANIMPVQSSEDLINSIDCMKLKLSSDIDSRMPADTSALYDSLSPTNPSAPNNSSTQMGSVGSTEASYPAEGMRISLNNAMIGHLERRRFLPSANPSYVELLPEIARIFEKHPEVVTPLFFPSPSDSKLLVLGPGVGKARDEITRLNDNFNSFQIIVSELEPVFRTKKLNLPVYTEPFVSTISCRICTSYPRAGTHLSVVGGYLKDDIHSCKNLILVATAGHAILNENEQRELADSNQPNAVKILTRDIRDKAAERSRNRLQVEPHNASSIYARDELFVAYNHFIPSCEERSEPSFLADICLLQVNASQLDEHITANTVQQSEFLSHISEGPSISSRIHPARSIRVSGYIDITDESDFDKLRAANVTLIVDGVKDGKLIERPRTIDKNDKRFAFTPKSQPRQSAGVIAPHFAFTINTGRLLPGKSGSEILVHNEDEDVCYILGLLIGRFIGASEVTTNTVYQAMPYGPAIRSLMSLYDGELRNLRPSVGQRRGVRLSDTLESLT